MSDVVLLECKNYDLSLVKGKINDCFNLLGGLDKLIKKYAKVFIKLNCVGPFAPEMGITTHPIFVKAVIQLLKERTKNIIIGDNPATKDITFTLKKCGIYEVIEEENVEIFNGKELTVIQNPTANVYSQFEVSKQMIDVDCLINLPKLKTHSLAYMTVAQKNLFGFIYGLNKASWHVRADNPYAFNDALADLYGAILNSYQNKTMIHICDGIIGLEGEGPSTAGLRKEAGVILASLDAISLDRVAVEVMSLNYDKFLMNKIADSRGYGEGKLDNINILGNSLDDFKDLKFLEPQNPYSISWVRLLKYKPIRNLLLEHPVINHNLCIKCGECAKICPPKTMQISPKHFPHLSTTKCIRCWCCAEVCPQNAISKSKRPLLGKILLKTSDNE